MGRFYTRGLVGVEHVPPARRSAARRGEPTEANRGCRPHVAARVREQEARMRATVFHGFGEALLAAASPRAVTDFTGLR